LARYLELGKNDIFALADQYGLTLQEFFPIEGGAGNTSYLLHSHQDKYVLTLFDDKSRAEVDKLGQLLLLLEEYGFASTRLVPPVQGGITVMYADKPVMLKHYINGDVCRNLDFHMLSQTGATMAAMHQLPVPHQLLKHEHSYGLQLFESVIGRNIDTRYESWLSAQLSYLTQKIPADAPWGFIHGDLFYDNLLFNGHELSAIIDFEEACFYYQTFDIGMGIVGMCRDGASIAPAKAKALVAGYQRVRTLERSEKMALQLFAEYAATATSCWRYWKYNIQTPIAQNAGKHWEMVRLAKHIGVMDAGIFGT
jgi:homoserine kinase type II